MEKSRRKDNVENEKTFMDRGSGFVEISSYRLWDNWSMTGA